MAFFGVTTRLDVEGREGVVWDDDDARDDSPGTGLLMNGETNFFVSLG